MSRATLNEAMKHLRLTKEALANVASGSANARAAAELLQETIVLRKKAGKLRRKFQPVTPPTGEASAAEPRA